MALRHALALCLALGAASPALSQSALGTWATTVENGLYGHVEIGPCGAQVCGTVTKAFDAAGKPTHTPNVGRRILRGFAPGPGGTLASGQVYVPRMGAEFDATLTPRGDRLEIRACNALGLCRSQTWTRVR